MTLVLSARKFYRIKKKNYCVQTKIDGFLLYTGDNINS